MTKRDPDARFQAELKMCARADRDTAESRARAADQRVAEAEADRDTAEDERDQLIKLITLNGFTVMRGDFMLRDGTHSAFHVRPTDVRRLLNNALVALNRPED